EGRERAVRAGALTRVGFGGTPTDGADPPRGEPLGRGLEVRGRAGGDRRLRGPLPAHPGPHDDAATLRRPRGVAAVLPAASLACVSARLVGDQHGPLTGRSR